MREKREQSFDLARHARFKLISNVAGVIGFGLLFAGILAHPLLKSLPGLSARSDSIGIGLMAIAVAIMLVVTIFATQDANRIRNAPQSSDNGMLPILLDKYYNGAHLAGLQYNRWGINNSRIQDDIRETGVKLVRTLPKVQESDGIRLSAHQHAVLRELLENTNPYMVSGSLHAMEVLGNADDLAAIDSFIQEASADEPWQLQSAQSAADAIRARLSSVDAVTTLVRASSMPDAQPDELVRSVASDGPESHPEEMLRGDNLK